MIAPSALESERLRLSPVGPEDLADMTALFAHPGMTEFMALQAEMKTPEGVKLLVKAVDASHRSQGPVVLLAIRLKDSGEFAGACGLAKAPDLPYAECLYAIVPRLQGRGLATEAMTLLLRYAFLETDLPEVVAHVTPDNAASVRVLEKIGPSTGMAALGPVKHPQFRDKVLLFWAKRADFPKHHTPE